MKADRVIIEFARGVIAPLAVAIAIAFVLAFALLNNVADRQNGETRERTDYFAGHILDQTEEFLADTVTDYAYWGALYDHMHVRIDQDWAYREGNLGDSIFKQFGFDHVLVFDAENRPAYAVVRGELVDTARTAPADERLEQLIAKARSDGASESKAHRDVFRIGGAPALVAAAAISTGADPTRTRTAGQPSTLVFALELNPALLEKLGAQQRVPGLRVARDAADAAREPRLVFGGDAAADRIVLRWDPLRPGDELRAAILPWLSLAVFGTIGLVAMVLRQSRRAASALAIGADRLQLAYREVEHRALHDVVTGLPNRLALASRLTSSLEVGAPCTVFYLDLDRFKPINDLLGHHAGDQALGVIARRLRSSVRPLDLVARVGGDEFVVTAEGLSQADLHDLAARLIETVSRPIRLDAGVAHLGVSIGVASPDGEALDAEELIRRADMALYQAKGAGRGVHRLFSKELNDEIVHRRTLEADLRRAIDQDELFLVYQPRYDIKTLALNRFEALLRWRHPSRGLIQPAEFIPLSEETGQIAELGAWALTTACRQALEFSGVGVAVNISPVQFRGGGLVGLVSEALSASGLPPGRLELELTETVLLDNANRAAETLRALKALGVDLAMDDFGAGYSSLRYLRTFPFDRLKIDRSFVADLEPTGQSRAIVQAILRLAAALGMTTTSEGVTSREQLMLLRLDGCDEAQGFFLSRPVPFEEAVRLSAHRRSPAAKPSPRRAAFG